MAFLAARETSPSNYNNLLNPDDLEDGGNFEDDEDAPAPLDLGYYGEEPFLPSPYDTSSFNNNKPISLMSSGTTTADLSRMGLHLSQVPGSHGLYLSPQPNAPLGMNLELPGNSHFPAQRIQADDGNRV